MISDLFIQDLAANDGGLSHYVIRQALSSRADRAMRQDTCRLFFDTTNGKEGATVFANLLGLSTLSTLDDAIQLLLHETEEQVAAMVPPDVATKKAYRQAMLCKRLLRRDSDWSRRFVHRHRDRTPRRSAAHHVVACERRHPRSQVGPGRSVSTADYHR